MECRETERLIDAYLDRTLSARVVQELESHLASCTACGQRHGPMMELLSSPAPTAVPAGLRDRIIAAVDDVAAGRASGRRVQESAKEVGLGSARSKRLRWVAWGGAVAASIAFVTVGWMGAGWFGRPQRPTEITRNPPKEHPTVVLSPWMLSSLAQAMTTQGPVNPVAFAAQATVTELFATPRFDDLPDIPARRYSATRKSLPSDADSPSPEIPVLPPILRL